MTLTSNNHDKEPFNTATDAFLESMSFASGIARECDCDECGWIPRPIAEAIREHKKLKLLTEPLPRMQDRSLVAREQGISVWKLTMPLEAEPLVEFGNSHRIVLVDTLSPQSALKSIGKGIIGCSDEERSRTILDWKQGMAYWIPYNGGKALGWIHSKSASDSQEDTDSSKPIGHAILYTIKITPDQLDKGESEGGEEGWIGMIRDMFQKLLTAGNDGADDMNEAAIPGATVQLDKEDCHAMQNLIKELTDKK